MKLAVLSDIHANWPALAATMADVDAWRPDLVLVNGDVVNSGPSNVACWEAVRQRAAADGWVLLRGNHEEYVAEWLEYAGPRHGPAYDLIRLSEWTYRQLDDPAAAMAMAALPERWQWAAPDGSRLVAMHASPLGNRAGIYPFTSDDEARRKIVPGAAVFLTAHTHVPHQRLLDGTQVVNTGSIGLPGDGDGRASYGRVTWERRRGWRAEIVRVAYDRAAAERDFFDSGFLAEAGPEAEMALVEFRAARDARTRWRAIYGDSVRRGELTLGETIRLFLDETEFRPFALATTGG
ncbi:MAG: metallophosphoesterase family protein [Candidatus Promineofilum sp.]|nr:metallophosphoesterase family protein [Promineifilum sp.]